MNETKLRTIAQLQDFLKAIPQVSFSGVDEKDKDERYAHISQVLRPALISSMPPTLFEGKSCGVSRGGLGGAFTAQ